MWLALFFPALLLAETVRAAGKSPRRQAGSSHSSRLRAPKTRRLHTKRSIAFLTDAGKSSVSKPQNNLDQYMREVTDVNKHAGKG